MPALRQHKLPSLKNETAEAAEPNAKKTHDHLQGGVYDAVENLSVPQQLERFEAQAGERRVSAQDSHEQKQPGVPGKHAFGFGHLPEKADCQAAEHVDAERADRKCPAIHHALNSGAHDKPQDAANPGSYEDDEVSHERRLQTVRPVPASLRPMCISRTGQAVSHTR